MARLRRRRDSCFFLSLVQGILLYFGYKLGLFCLLFLNLLESFLTVALVLRLDLLLRDDQIAELVFLYSGLRLKRSS